MSGTTCGWTNLEGQSGLVLVSSMTCDHTHRIRSEYGPNMDRQPSKRRQKINEKSTQNRGNIDTRSTENRQEFLEVEF